jgi:hypothetical protein
MPLLNFIRLRNVSHFDGLLNCRVPRDFVQQIEEDGTRVFWKPKGISGTLRISLLTAKRDTVPDGNPAMFLLGNSKDMAPAIELSNGNVYRCYREESSEDGEALAIYWFKVANYIPPVNYRLALFSFTVRLAEEASAEIQRQLAILNKELPACRFSREVQSWEK